MRIFGFLFRHIGPAVLVASLLVTLAVPSAFASDHAPRKAGIEKTAGMIQADLDRMFPCAKKSRECNWSFNILSSKPSSLIDSIEARPEMYRVKGARMIRLEPNPIYGKFMLYMFPRWKGADLWLARSLEKARHTSCPKIAHIGNAWVIVRGEFFEVLGYIRAELTVTRLASELASSKRADEDDCEGPRVIEEIR